MSATLHAPTRSTGRSFGLLGCAAAIALCSGCFAAPAPTVGPAPSTAANESRGSDAQALELDAAGNVATREYEGIPTGDQRLGGVQFRIGESAMRVGSRSFPEFPPRVSGVDVGRPFRVAHFLHATNGGAFRQPGHPKHESDGVTIGEYLVRYADGSQETFTLRYGHEARDFWNWDDSQPTKNSEVVWNGENPDAAKFGVKVRLYKASWLNPHPKKQVATIDLVSANANAAPVCFAITVDDDSTFESRTNGEPLHSPFRPATLPSSEVASASLSADRQSTTEAPVEISSSATTPERSKTLLTELTRDVPATSPTSEAIAAEASESPTLSDDTLPSGAKPAFNLFGASDVPAEPDEPATEGPDFLGPPPERWEVVVDPAAALPLYPAELPYERIEGIRPRRIVVPATPSYFLAIEEGQSDIEGFRVFDLRSGRATAAVDGMNLSKSTDGPFDTALSPDGRLTAVYDFSSESIYVGDVQKRKTQNRFSWKGSEPILLFAKADTLVAIERTGSPRVEVWQLPLGARLASFELADQPELSPPLVALSPGGRFLVLSVAGTPPEVATFYDLTTGKEAGALALKGKIVDAYFLAFGFSSDGKEFAGYMHGIENKGQPVGIHSAVVVWDVETGRPTYQSAYEYGGFDAALPKSDRPLQWFPDGEGWLLSQLHVFDRKSGRIVRSFTERMHAGLETTGAQILDDGRLLISDASADGIEIVDDARSAPVEVDR